MSKNKSSASSSNGRTAAFGPANEGSSPSEASTAHISAVDQQAGTVTITNGPAPAPAPAEEIGAFFDRTKEKFVDDCAIQLFVRGRAIQDCWSQAEYLWNAKVKHYTKKVR